ncbi:MAG: LCP family protein [Candidatus Bipolaricaulota bacterium]
MRGNSVRKTILYGAAGAMVCGIALLAWALTATDNDPPWVRGLGNILLAFEGETGDGVGVEALGVLTLGGSRAALLWVPEDLTAEGTNCTARSLGDVGAICGWACCGEEVGAILGLTMDAYVVLRPGAAARLLESVGGVRVDVRGTVTYRSPSGAGAGELTLHSGDRHLDAEEALAYARGSSSGETEADRRGKLLGAFLSAASVAASDGVPRAIRDELRRAESNLTWAERLDVFEELVDRVPAVASAEVPTRVVVRDGEARRVALAVETEQLIASLVRGRVVLRPEDVTVAVFNGNGLRLAATRGAEYLMDRGFRVSRVTNAESFDYELTMVVVLTDLAKAWILRDALPGDATITTPEEFAPRYDALRAMVPLGTDVVLVVGAGMEFGR